MPVFTDQTGFSFELKNAPQHIISTVPSQTELLYELGLEERVAGITAYCVHPSHWLDSKKVIGGTKDLKTEKILALKPDLIIGNKEENVKEQIEYLRKHCPVWLSDITGIEDALDMITSVGELTGAAEKAQLLYKNITAEKLKLKKPEKPLRVAYFIWKEPMMLAGKETFIGKMIEACGFVNAASTSPLRYPQISFDKIASLEADIILLSSEPYPFTASDLHDLAKANPHTKCRIVDGELFSWYGSRMKKAFRYLQTFLTGM